MDFVDDALMLYAHGRKNRQQLEAVLIYTAFTLVPQASPGYRKRIEAAIRDALSGLDQDVPLVTVGAAVQGVMAKAAAKAL